MMDNYGCTGKLGDKYIIVFLRGDVMQVYFDNGIKKRKIADVDNEKDARKAILDFCKKNHFTVYYMRMWNQDNETVVDVGSHTQFFYITNHSS